MVTVVAHTIYSIYTGCVLDWTGQRLARLRKQFPGWDIWAVRGIYPRPHATWCARPKGRATATINADSVEELARIIREQERQHEGP